jgi:hypothetical protein
MAGLVPAIHAVISRNPLGCQRRSPNLPVPSFILHMSIFAQVNDKPWNYVIAKQAVLSGSDALTFAHATHEDRFVTSWNIMIVIPQWRARTAPFRPVWDGFGRLSLEILYSTAHGRPRKPVSGFGFPDCLCPVMGHNREIGSLLSRSTDT